MISILVTTYNRSSLLKQRISSILDQTYNNFEIIIIDDCSSDNTSEVINSFNDDRIRSIKNLKNLGSIYGDRIHIYEFLYKYASGDYFIYAPDDDYWPDNNFLREVMNYFDEFPSLQIVIGNQVTEYYDNANNLRIYDIKKINNFLDNNDQRFFFFGNLLPKSGFYKKDEYLELFSKSPTTFNISGSAIVFKLKTLKKINYLKHETPSKWQAGYELVLPNFFIGDIYMINKPCAVVRANKNNASFKFTQKEHYSDQILSVANAFSIDPNLSKFHLLKKKEFVRSISQAYLFNSISIFKDKELSLCSNENISKHVTVYDVFKNYFHFKIIPSVKDIKIIVSYFYHLIISK